MINEKASRGEMGAVEAVEERNALAKATQQKIDDLRSIFAIADPDQLEKREVPDHLIDNISFEIMHDREFWNICANVGHRGLLMKGQLSLQRTVILTKEQLSLSISSEARWTR